jgi:hypothetical protein
MLVYFGDLAVKLLLLPEISTKARSKSCQAAHSFFPPSSENLILEHHTHGL